MMIKAWTGYVFSLLRASPLGHSHMQVVSVQTYIKPELTVKAKS